MTMTTSFFHILELIPDIYILVYAVLSSVMFCKVLCSQFLWKQGLTVDKFILLSLCCSSSVVWTQTYAVFDGPYHSLLVFTQYSLSLAMLCECSYIIKSVVLKTQNN